MFKIHRCLALFGAEEKVCGPLVGNPCSIAMQSQKDYGYVSKSTNYSKP